MSNEKLHQQIEAVRGRLLELSDPAERERFDRKLREWAEELGLPESKRHLLLRITPRLLDANLDRVVPLMEQILAGYEAKPSGLVSTGAVSDLVYIYHQKRLFWHKARPSGIKIPLVRFDWWSKRAPVDVFSPAGAPGQDHLTFQNSRLGIEVNLYQLPDGVAVQVVDLEDSSRGLKRKVTLLRGTSVLASGVTAKEDGWVRFQVSEPLEPETTVVTVELP